MRVFFWLSVEASFGMVLLPGFGRKKCAIMGFVHGRVLR